MSNNNDRTFAAVTSEDIKQCILRGEFISVIAEKNKPVSARAGVVGEQIVTLVDDGALTETTNTVKKDGDMVVTNIIEGCTNSYVVKAEKFAALYSAVAGSPGVFKPVSGPKEVFIIDRDIQIVAPWGEQMKLRAGAALVPDSDCFYGINPSEFAATYAVSKEQPQEKMEGPSKLQLFRAEHLAAATKSLSSNLTQVAGLKPTGINKKM